MHCETRFYGKNCGEQYSFDEKDILSYFKVQVCCNMCKKEQSDNKQLATICCICKNKCSQFSNVKFQYLSVETYSCKVCKKICNTIQDLKRHTKIHTEHLFVCCICEAMFPDLFSLEIHFMSHPNEHHTCKICKINFKAEEDLQLHVKMHYVRESFVCELCRKTRSSFCKCGEDLLVCSSHDEKYPVCQKIANQEVDLIQLLIESVDCAQSKPAHWNDENSLSVVRKGQHPQGTYKEWIRDNIFLRPQRAVSNHEVMFQERYSLPIKKTLLGGQDSCAVFEERLIKTEPIDENELCKMCEMCFGPTILNKFSKTKLHDCDKCHRFFPSCCLLRKHLYRSRNFKQFHCRVCRKSFVRSSNLHGHEQRHVKEVCFQNTAEKSF